MSDKIMYKVCIDIDSDGDFGYTSPTELKYMDPITERIEIYVPDKEIAKSIISNVYDELATTIYSHREEPAVETIKEFAPYMNKLLAKNVYFSLQMEMGNPEIEISLERCKCVERDNRIITCYPDHIPTPIYIYSKESIQKYNW